MKPKRRRRKKWHKIEKKKRSQDGDSKNARNLFFYFFFYFWKKFRKLIHFAWQCMIFTALLCIPHTCQSFRNAIVNVTATFFFKHWMNFTNLKTGKFFQSTSWQFSFTHVQNESEWAADMKNDKTNADIKERIQITSHNTQWRA